MKKLALIGLLAVTGVAASANAFQVQCRWVSRVGTVDTPIPAGGLPVTPGQVINLRLQFSLATDGQGAPPAGGFIGWNVGTINGTPDTAGSNAARLQPFNFAPPPGFGGTQNPLHLNNVDNTLGTQAISWTGIPGTADPGSPPPAVVRGNNTFVSVFAVTVTAGATDFDVTAAGNAIAATSWNVISSTTPDPGDDGVFGTPDDTAGNVTYAPATLPPIPFSNCVAHFVQIPAPGAAALLGLGGLVACRRRRS